MTIETKTNGYLIENEDGDAMLIPFSEVAELATVLMLEELRSRISELVSEVQYDLDFDKYRGTAPEFIDEVMAGLENIIITGDQMPSASLIRQEIELVAGTHYMIITD